MDTHTETAGAAATAPIYQPKQIDEGRRNGLVWRVWMHGASMFRFVVQDAATDEILHDDPKETYPNAGKAGLAANEWCREEVRRRYDAEAAAAAPPEDWSPTLPPAQVVAGWTIQVVADKRGTFACDVHNAATGEVAPVEFKGYAAWGNALDHALAWASANPCDGTVVEVTTGPAPSPAEEVAADLGRPAPPATEAPQVETAFTAPTDELTLLREQLATQTAELEQARRSLVAQAADLKENAAAAREMAVLAADLSELEAEKKVISDTIKVISDTIKVKQGRLELLGGKLARATIAVDEGKKPQPYQRPLTFADDAVTREAVGNDAAQVAEQLTRPDAWTYLGREYSIDVEPVAEGGYEAWLRGYRASTAAQHETREGAVEAAKGRAATVLDDAEPGETPPADATPAAAATGQRKPPKAGPKLKGGGAAYDADAVRATLRNSKEVLHAIEALGVTRKQLEGYCKRVNIDIGATLNTSPTELPPAPAETVPAKGRGRGRGRGK